MVRAVPPPLMVRVQSLAYGRRGFEPPRGWCSEVVWGFLLPNYLLLRVDGTIGHAAEFFSLFVISCRRRILYFLVYLYHFYAPYVVYEELTCNCQQHHCHQSILCT